jgi:hypothetical protein
MANLPAPTTAAVIALDSHRRDIIPIGTIETVEGLRLGPEISLLYSRAVDQQAELLGPKPAPRIDHDDPISVISPINAIVEPRVVTRQPVTHLDSLATTIGCIPGTGGVPGKH